MGIYDRMRMRKQISFPVTEFLSTEPSVTKYGGKSIKISIIKIFKNMAEDITDFNDDSGEEIELTAAEVLQQLEQK